jgi:hypothetical protein
MELVATPFVNGITLITKCASAATLRCISNVAEIIGSLSAAALPCYSCSDMWPWRRCRDAEDYSAADRRQHFVNILSVLAKLGGSLRKKGQLWKSLVIISS